MPGETSFSAPASGAEDTVSAIGGALITPDDDNDLVRHTRGILIGTGGALKITYVNGDIDTIPAVTGYNPLQVKRVWASDTEAEDIHALY